MQCVLALPCGRNCSVIQHTASILIKKWRKRKFHHNYKTKRITSSVKFSLIKMFLAIPSHEFSKHLLINPGQIIHQGLVMSQVDCRWKELKNILGWSELSFSCFQQSVGSLLNLNGWSDKVDLDSQSFKTKGHREFYPGQLDFYV